MTAESQRGMNMPQQTFFNLPAEKKEMIINIALEEFALNDYKTASVTRIVKKAGIAKGSMYQYFENKEDLYAYLIKLGAEKKFNYMAANLATEGKDFFETLMEMHMVGLEFDLNNIKYSKVLANLMNEINNIEISPELHKILQQGENFMKQYVARAQQEGQIRDDIELDLINFVISQISVSISDYIGKKYNFSYYELIRAGEKEIPVNNDILKKELNNLIKILRDGLSRP